MGWKQAIAAGWQRRGANALLLPPAYLFAAVVALRRVLYRAGVLKVVRLPVPVIVVGNITAGGSGKTPLTLYLAQKLALHGWHPGIVSRGYGGNLEGIRAVTPESDPVEVGDEPLLLARRAGCPVFVGHDRVAAARSLLEAHPACDVLIADDGLQHLRLARDVELIVIDERGTGNGWPLPAGPLRDCPQRIAAADALVLNGDDASAPGRVTAPEIFRMRLVGARLRNVRDPRKSCEAGELRGKRLHAIAGTGNPARFFRLLDEMGLQFATHAFPDHHSYCAADLAFADAEALLMTEKDAVKCSAFAPGNAWHLPVEAMLAPDLAEWVANRLDRRRHGRQTS
jgi:tetraacyldisaccharide 4'-kinase